MDEVTDAAIQIQIIKYQAQSIRNAHENPIGINHQNHNIENLRLQTLNSNSIRFMMRISVAFHHTFSIQFNHQIKC